MLTKVGFEVSKREYIDLLATSRRPGYKALHWIVVAGAGVFVALKVIGEGEQPMVRLVVAMTLGLATAGVMHLLTESLNRWHYSRYLTSVLGPQERLPIEVELREEGVLFQQLGQEILLRWTGISRAKVGEAGVEIWSPERMVGLVRSRAFETNEEEAAFTDEINRRATGG